MNVEKKIDGVIYRFSPMPAREALALLADLTRLGGPAFGRLPQLIVALNSGDENQTAMADVAALQMIADMLRTVETHVIIDLLDRILSSVDVHTPSGDWRKFDFDGDLIGKLRLVIPIVNQAVMVQYGDFFPASGANGILAILKASLQKVK